MEAAVHFCPSRSKTVSTKKSLLSHGSTTWCVHWATGINGFLFKRSIVAQNSKLVLALLKAGDALGSGSLLLKPAARGNGQQPTRVELGCNTV